MLLQNLNQTAPEHACYEAQAAYDNRKFSKPRRYRMHEITAHTVKIDDPSRAEVEAFIHYVFKQSYNANITEFMPELIALRDANGVLMAAFGTRSAAKESLFLEQYIDMPIEQLISKRLGKAISRDAITCIGNLAVANPRNAGLLVAHVIQHNLNIGIEWCVATAHHSLQNGIIKGGRDVYPLAPADKSRLPVEEQALWGNYYDSMPQIVAIRGIAEY